MPGSSDGVARVLLVSCAAACGGSAPPPPAVAAPVVVVVPGDDGRTGPPRVAPPLPAPVARPVPPPPPPPSTRAVRAAGAVFQVPDAWEDCALPTVQACARDTAILDGFHTNVNLVVEPFTRDTEAYARANATAVSRLASIESSDVATVGGMSVVLSVTLWPGTSSGVPYRTLQLLATDGRQGYVVTCSAAASAFARERRKCEEIVRTFELP